MAGWQRCGKPGICLLKSFDAGQPRGFFRKGKKAGADGVGGEAAQLVVGKALLGVREQELVGQIGAEDGRVVGVEGDQETAVEVGAQGMSGEGGADAGADVGGGIEFDGSAARPEVQEQVFIVDGRQGVADALGADGEGLPDGFGAGGFTGVVGEAQTGFAGAGVEGAEGLGAGASLVAAEADADDGGVSLAQFCGLTKDALGLFEGEMAYGVEDPIERDAEFVSGAQAGAFEGFKDGFEAAGIEVAPHVNDADGDEDLGVNDALVVELLQHAPGDEFVVAGLLEAAGDGFEAFDEAAEVVEAIEGFGLMECEGEFIVAGAELDEGGGQDGAFKVEVQLGFGEAADEGLDGGHNSSVAGRAELRAPGGGGRGANAPYNQSQQIGQRKSSRG